MAGITRQHPPRRTRRGRAGRQQRHEAFLARQQEKALIVGMPVPGTATAVWWETLQDPSLYFGIPQVGMLDMNGHYLENQQLEPDVLVNNDPASVAEGRDLQLEKAVEVLMNGK